MVFLRDGLRRKVENGLATEVWPDPWRKGKGNEISNGKVIMYCNAVWKGGLHAGCGYIVKGENEEMLLQGKGIETAGSPIQAEAKAIWYELDNLRKKGTKKLIVGTDSERLVKILNGEFEAPWNISVLIRRITNLALELEVDGWIHHTCEEE
ncbi:hypothetical protein Cni_G15591 [Canna indica]|uniref:RNase H type-1 domain-containing protein n=1 Tax=Canna indica TaxID=4628 RepID=A0AAQ3QEX3_9LILI|nr:hypothetical protein Cni_G15591 [Canna indica]